MWQCEVFDAVRGYTVLYTLTPTMPKRVRDTSTTDAGKHGGEYEYAAWLRSRGVSWNEDALTTTTAGVVAGWGVVATEALSAGDVLFSIPREACFGARAANADAPPLEADTQEYLATLLLRERKKGTTSSWAPLVAMLTETSCPFAWPEAAQRYLDGTELAPVLVVKRQKLATERAGASALQRVKAREYAKACALATSHANPWFGGSIVPFNTTLNWSAHPNVEFEPSEGGEACVVGRATREISSGEEVHACPRIELGKLNASYHSAADLPRV